jgi:hypothetical protein
MQNRWIKERIGKLLKDDDLVADYACELIDETDFVRPFFSSYMDTA